MRKEIKRERKLGLNALTIKNLAVASGGVPPASFEGVFSCADTCQGCSGWPSCAGTCGTCALGCLPDTTVGDGGGPK